MSPGMAGRQRLAGRRRVGARQQRGVALIIALILVALAVILATKLSFDGWLERRRTLGVLAAEQALHFGLGAEALAADALTQAANSQQVSLDQPWAQPTQPLPLTPPDDPEGEPIGTLQGALEDMQGRFNLNNLAGTVTLGGGSAPGGLPGGTLDPAPLAQFQRLLVSVGLEPKWACIARDWITPTDVPCSPDGAKDAIYTAQTPPYRTGEYPMMSASELMNLPGFGADRYRKIAPYVTALPGTGTKINLCTAPAFVLESLADNLNGEWSRSPDLLVSERKKGCFPITSAFQSIATGADPKNGPAAANFVAETSAYFRLTTRVTLGTTEFTLYSLLKRPAGGGGGGKVTPILRTFGTP
ncbi:MAG: ral secretion pathway protein [Gammaproteobacteria bacterium]|nr:ral secretion pathway protein [Gammaproteobacteria bacterium]